MNLYEKLDLFFYEGDSLSERGGLSRVEKLKVHPTKTRRHLCSVQPFQSHISPYFKSLLCKVHNRYKTTLGF